MGELKGKLDNDENLSQGHVVSIDTLRKTVVRRTEGCTNKGINASFINLIPKIIDPTAPTAPSTLSVHVSTR